MGAEDSLVDLLEAFDALVVDLNADWRLHKELFQVDKNYVLFFESGPLPWHILRDTLIDSVFLSVARLLDPAKTGNRENLSFAHVISKVDPGEQRTEIEKQYEELRSRYGSALRHWRNKKLSHNDLLTATGTAALPKISYDEVSQLVDGVNKIAQKIGHVVLERHTTFVPVVSNKEWVWQLTETLSKGIAARKAEFEARKKRFEEPNIPEGS
jgi:hypothetical protein